MNRKNQRRLAFVLALILMFTFVPGALAASFSAVVQSDRMTVYGDNDLFEQLAGKVEKVDLIGDAVSVGRIPDAVESAYKLAATI